MSIEQGTPQGFWQSGGWKGYSWQLGGFDVEGPTMPLTEIEPQDSAGNSVLPLLNEDLPAPETEEGGYDG
jgi:hypothetical protein